MARAVVAGSSLAALALIACSGCGEDGKAAPVSTVPVKGMVRYKGRPLTRGVIQFEPASIGREASGEIQPDGTFTLSTYGTGDGAVLGPHRVAVTGAGKAVPVKYSNFASSRIEVEVTANQTDYSIDLK